MISRDTAKASTWAKPQRCPICAETGNQLHEAPQMTLLFHKTLLHRYRVGYYGCDRCGFVQTEPPYWLAEAYADQGIAALDTGIVDRNLRFARQTERLIRALRPNLGLALDFGGGSGLFVRLMRDRGFEFYRSDRYTENLFARGFDHSDLPPQTHFDLITAFEVVEHLPEPLPTLKQLWAQTDLLLFSTELLPERSQLSTWDYLYPEAGQHVAFLGRATLEAIAQHLGAQLLSNDRDLHLLSRQPLPPRRAALLSKPLWQRGLGWLGRRLRRRASLIDRDMEQIRRTMGYQ